MERQKLRFVLERQLAQIDVPSPKRILHMVVAGIFGGGVATLILVLVTKFWPGALVSGKMSYPELATVVLTGVAVLITILGVFVAILAIWGFGNFEDIAKKSAKAHVKDQIKSGKLRSVVEDAAREYLEREFNEDGSLRIILQSRIDSYLLNDAERRTSSSSGPGATIDPNDDDEEEE